MLIPKIEQTTIDNITREFFRAETPYDYIMDKIQQTKEHSPELLKSIDTLADTMYVQNDDGDDDTKLVNKLRAVSLALIVVNCINTQMEIDWLRGWYNLTIKIRPENKDNWTTVLKRYLNFCFDFVSKIVDEMENERGYQVIAPQRLLIVLTATILPLLAIVTLFPLMLAIFLLYGIGTNLYTAPAAASLVFYSVSGLFESIDRIKEYTYPEDWTTKLIRRGQPCPKIDPLRGPPRRFRRVGSMFGPWVSSGQPWPLLGPGKFFDIF